MENPVPITSDPLVTDWITAVATACAALFTFLAAVGTVGALLVSYRLLRREAARDQEGQERLRRAQADRVHGYATTQPAKPLPEWDWPVKRAVYVVENKSDGLIYNVHLPRADGSVFPLCPVVLPGGRHEEPIELVDEVEQLGLADGSIPVIGVTFRFTDRAATQWTRHHDGELEEAPGDPLAAAAPTATDHQ